jgi:di/tripeptidase
VNAEKSSVNAEKLSRNAESSMSDIVIEMHEKIALLAGDRTWHDSRDSWLSRAARNAGISYRTAKALFYKERPDPKSSVVELVRGAVEKMNREQEETARNDYEAGMLLARSLGGLGPADSDPGRSRDDVGRRDLDAGRGDCRAVDRATDDSA